MNIGDVHHAGYLVKDICKSMHVFMALGFIPEKDLIYDETRESRFCFMKKGHTRVELVEPSEKSDIYPLLKTYKNSIYHVCYETNDIETSINELKGQGFLLFRGKQKAPAISESAEVVFLMHARMGIRELMQEVSYK